MVLTGMNTLDDDPHKPRTDFVVLRCEVSLKRSCQSKRAQLTEVRFAG